MTNLITIPEKFEKYDEDTYIYWFGNQYYMQFRVMQVASTNSFEIDYFIKNAEYLVYTDFTDNVRDAYYFISGTISINGLKLWITELQLDMIESFHWFNELLEHIRNKGNQFVKPCKVSNCLK